MELSARQQQQYASFQLFTEKEIVPHAEQWDRDEVIPQDFVELFAAQGYLGALVPTEYGGQGYDAVTFGLLNEAVGFGCSSVRSVLTVHSMLVHAVARWGTSRVRERWLPLLASGARVGAFALTEEGSGSDAGNLQTQAVRTDEGFVLSGAKRWTTYGQRADVFLVFALCDGKATAFLVDRDTPGLDIVPINGMLGTRASMLAELRFSECQVPADNLIGRVGFGIAAVATSALDIGRYSVAWGCVGILAAALKIALDHTGDRVQFGVALADHQLIQRMIADMSTGLTAARLLCFEAGVLKDKSDPRTVTATWTAKYFASCRAFQATADTVQILGASGCAADHPAARLLRDAKIMEIIEGSTQIQQIYLAKAAYQHSRLG